MCVPVNIFAKLNNKNNSLSKILEEEETNETLCFISNLRVTNISFHLFLLLKYYYYSLLLLFLLLFFHSFSLPRLRPKISFLFIYFGITSGNWSAKQNEDNNDEKKKPTHSRNARIK